MWFIFVPNFVKIFMTVLKIQSGHHFDTENYKGLNAVKIFLHVVLIG